MDHIHHIIPKHEWVVRFGSLDGVSSNDNLVVLTIEQHSLAHLYLWEQFGREQDFLAYKSLSRQLDKIEILKFSARLGGSMGRNNPKKCGNNNHFFGRCHSLETKRIIGEKSKGRNKGRAPWNRGLVEIFHHTNESKNKIRNSKLGVKRKNFVPWNKGKVGLQIAWNKGKKI